MSISTFLIVDNGLSPILVSSRYHRSMTDEILLATLLTMTAMKSSRKKSPYCKIVAFLA